MGTPVDAKHLCKDHLDTWGRQEGKINTSPGRPAAAPMLKSQNPKTTAPRTLSTRSTATRTYFDTGNHGRKKQGRPRRGPPGVQDRRGLHLYFLHPWDSGQEITGVQGMSPAAYIQTLDRCRRRWRRLVQARSPGERGRGDFNGRRAAGLDFSTTEEVPLSPPLHRRCSGAARQNPTCRSRPRRPGSRAASPSGASPWTPRH